MLDLNHILLFIAAISPLVVLFRTTRGGAEESWRRVALVVLAVTVIAWLVRRNRAGFIGGGAWFFCLFLPAWAFRKAAELAQQQHFAAARRLLSLLRFVHPARGLREHAAFVDALESASRNRTTVDPPIATHGPSTFAERDAGLTPAVAALIALNVAMFLAEIAFGGSTNFATLHRLGALEPYPVLAERQYWRLITAPFLHYGTLHLFLNLFALYYFGRTLERAIGAMRFTATYFLAGIGSCAEVALLWRAGWLHADQLVGASGAVMGVVGAWAGTLLHDRHIASARHQLWNIAMIVSVQTAFDLVTPQVSMAAHLGGFATGLLVGFALAPRRTTPFDAPVSI